MKTIKLAVPLLTLILLVSARTVPNLAGQNAKTDPGKLSEPLRQTSIPGLLHTWYRYWDKSYLVSWGSDSSYEASPSEPSVVLYDRGGHVVREGTIWLKDAHSVTIADVAVNKAGDLIVAGGTENDAGAIANYIASIGKDGRLSQIIRTTPFLPVYICAAEDGTVWSYGIDRDADGKGIEESLRLRQFSFDKGQVRALLDVSTLNSYGWTLVRGRYPGEINMRCSSQKVVLYNGRSSEWIELDFSTNKLKVAKVQPLPPPKEMRILGFAITDSGDVFVCLFDRSSNPARSGLFRLEFDSSGLGSWVPVTNTIAAYLHRRIDMLLGADGENLVYTRDFDGMAYWSKYTK